jgi:DNA-binding transcriptional ArsR family regulator
MLLEPLLGNKTAERVLLYLANYQQGYARDIAQTYETTLSMVQKQLTRLEDAGILVSRTLGKTRLYELNPRWFLFKELSALLQKALAAVPEQDVAKYYRKRQRPRRAGKPLWR